MAEEGCFRVAETPKDSDTPDGISFQLKRDFSGLVPDGQRKLQNNIQRFLVFLRANYAPNNEIFRRYYEKLFDLARSGLTADLVHTDVSLQAFESILTEFISQQGLAIKRRYTFKISLLAATLVLVFLATYLVVASNPPALRLSLYFPDRYILLTPIVLLWGTIGIWFSSILALMSWSLRDLVAMETEYVSWLTKTVAALIVTFIMLVLIMEKLVSFTIGSITITADQMKGPHALLLGFFCGLGFESLVSKVTGLAKSIGKDGR
jgi:hypothetical protein